MSLLDEWNKTANHQNNEIESPGNPFEQDVQTIVNDDNVSSSSLNPFADAPSIVPVSKPKVSNNSKPNFYLRRLEWKHAALTAKGKTARSIATVNGSLNCSDIGNNALCIGYSGNGCSVLYWSLDDDQSREFLISNNDRIYSIFIDPTGNHILVSLHSGDNFYIHTKQTTKLKSPIQKLSNIQIESVAWNTHQGTETMTHSILIGSTKGKIFQASFDGTKDTIMKEVYCLKEAIPICGIFFDHIQSDTAPNYFAMIATGKRTRYYQFIGGPTLEAMFSEYNTPQALSFWELPGRMERTELRFYVRVKDNRANSFALMTEEGIFHGTLHLSGKVTADNAISDRKMLYYPSRTLQDKNIENITPVSFAETEFHFLLLYSNRLIIMSKLTEKIIHEENFSEALHGKYRRIVYDSFQNKVYLYSQDDIYQLHIENEDSNVWKMYLDQAKNKNSDAFQLAYSFCKTETQRNMVLNTEADYQFQSGNFVKSAEIYAKTDRSFEQVSLIFIDGGHKDALRKYLECKLDGLPESQRTKRTILASWLVETFLERLNRLRQSVDATNCKEEQSMKIILWNFLKKYQESLKPVKDLVFNLMSSHGCEEEYLFYANLIEEYERMVDYFCRNREYTKALKLLNEQTDNWISQGELPKDEVQDLYYKYSSNLLDNETDETITLWIKSSFLDSEKLLPALIRFTQNQQEHVRREALRKRLANLTGTSIEEEQGTVAIDTTDIERYLEYCIDTNENEDVAIHNFLLSLYASKRDGGKVEKFIQRQPQFFEYKFALRVCSEMKHDRASVMLLSGMGLLEEAVRKAMVIDLEFAKNEANKAESNELRKKLWLIIAKHLILSKQETKVCIETINESGVLKIEDVLPFFPDFTLIDEFKDSICSSLEDYNQNIESLKLEMQEYTENAELIRQDISNLRGRFSQVTGSQTCDLCGNLVLSREFYVFPCTHAFHCDCLFEEVIKHVDRKQRERLLELKHLVADETNPSYAEHKASLDEFIGAACIFCGELMVQSIGEPFLTEKDVDEAKQWDL